MPRTPVCNPRVRGFRRWDLSFYRQKSPRAKHYQLSFAKTYLIAHGMLNEYEDINYTANVDATCVRAAGSRAEPHKLRLERFFEDSSAL
jgi:hypothetical protein